MGESEEAFSLFCQEVEFHYQTLQIRSSLATTRLPACWEVSGGRERWRRRWGGRLLLRCACGPQWKPIKVRFMFIKDLSKLKNFLINSNLAAARRWLGVPPLLHRLFACYNSRLKSADDYIRLSCEVNEPCLI